MMLGTHYVLSCEYVPDPQQLSHSDSQCSARSNMELDRAYRNEGDDCHTNDISFAATAVDHRFRI